MIVKDLMSSHIRTVLPDDPAELAAEIMRTENVGIVPKKKRVLRGKVCSPRNPRV